MRKKIALKACTVMKKEILIVSLQMKATEQDESSVNTALYMYVLHAMFFHLFIFSLKSVLIALSRDLPLYFRLVRQMFCRQTGIRSDREKVKGMDTLVSMNSKHQTGCFPSFHLTDCITQEILRCFIYKVVNISFIMLCKF